MIAFSTCWNSGRHTDGEAMLREIKRLGFDLIEFGTWHPYFAHAGCAEIF